jgi:hypothetical protein
MARTQQSACGWSWLMALGLVACGGQSMHDGRGNGGEAQGGGHRLPPAARVRKGAQRLLLGLLVAVVNRPGRAQAAPRRAVRLRTAESRAAGLWAPLDHSRFLSRTLLDFRRCRGRCASHGTSGCLSGRVSARAVSLAWARQAEFAKA